MDRGQLFFSAATGTSIMAAGAALAVSSTFGWSLFWVGAAITALTLASVTLQSPRRKSAYLLARIPVRQNKRS